MAFCTNCGQPVQPANKFCASCGTPLQTTTNAAPTVAPQYTPPPAPVYQSVPQYAPPAYPVPPPVYAPETIRCVISSLAITKSWGRHDDYTLVVTDRRSIFAKVTQEIMNAVINEASANAAAEGKGFFGKWGAQIKGFYNYGVRYNKFTPDQILQETQGNFAIENNTIRKIKIFDDTQEDSPGVEYSITFETVTGKLSFKSMYNQENLFKQAYGPAIVH